MRHGVSGRKFGRDSGKRRALFVNLAESLIQYEQIKTTLAKAKDLRPIVEKMVTTGKQGGLAARRKLLQVTRSKNVVDKLLNVLGDRYKQRPGGYTRIIKAGYRSGDMAPMAFIEFVERDAAAKNSGSGSPTVAAAEPKKATPSDTKAKKTKQGSEEKKKARAS